jgi:hypothetical protein
LVGKIKVVREAVLVHPEFEDRWTLADADEADQEGWNIYEAQGILEIERNDVNDPPDEDAPHFEYDDDAVDHVRTGAQTGSALHMRALAIHEKYVKLAAEGPTSADQS